MQYGKQQQHNPHSKAAKACVRIDELFETFDTILDLHEGHTRGCGYGPNGTVLSCCTITLVDDVEV